MTAAHHFANRRRLWTMSAIAAVAACACTALAISERDGTGRIIMSLFAALCGAVACRAPMLGVWVSEKSVVVRSWIRNRRFSLDDVVTFETREKRGGVYPAAVLHSSDVVPLPGLEVGILFEWRSADAQWGWALRSLNEMATEVRNTHYRQW